MTEAAEKTIPWTTFPDPGAPRGIPPWVAAAYAETYRVPQGDALGLDEADEGSTEADQADRTAGSAVVSPALMAAHARLAQNRMPGQTRVAVYDAGDEWGFGPALQVVTEHGDLLMDSVAVLLYRLGVAYLGMMTPVFTVRREADGRLRAVELENAHGSMTAPNQAETWIHVQLAPSVSRHTLAETARLLPDAMADVRQVATDSKAMRTALTELAADIETNRSGHYSAPDRDDVAALLHWLGDGHFVVLGYQRGVVRDGQVMVDDAQRLGVLRLRKSLRPRLTGENLLTLTQATVPSYMRFSSRTYVVVIREDTGDSIVAHRFVGLFTSTALGADVFEIPVVSHTVRQALALAEKEPGHPGQLLLDIIQTVPRSELFAISAQQLLTMAIAVSNLAARRGALLFLRGDRTGRFMSCLVYLPRDRYTTAVRLQMQDILLREFGGVGLEYSARVSEAPWALLHFMVRLSDDLDARPVDTTERNRIRIQALLSEATRTWGDRLAAEAAAGSLEAPLADHYAVAFPEIYKQATAPAEAVGDIAIIEQLSDDAVQLVFSDYGQADRAQLAWFLGGHGASLSQLLPMLQCMGVSVLEERPFTVTRADGLAVWIYKFTLTPDPSIEIPSEAGEREAAQRRFADAVTAIWQGRLEADRFNELVLRAGLTWQQVVVLRSYAKYLRQARFAYSESRIAEVLNEYPSIAAALVALFEALFDPSRANRSRDAQLAAADVAAGIDALVSLDTDRVLRAFASLIQATLRTNYFVDRVDSARAKDVLALKLDAGLIDELPLPRPKFEIFVYSPRVEGVHLRFGFVARGGLRWSDRREDYRTEILGLAKAQEVKNAVIVPVGAKGGFVVKRPPAPTGDPAADREAARVEGIFCYQLFVSGLLDLTDNVDHVTGAVSAPPHVVRRDADDAYLVVAADKGTASFSDIANAVATSYGYWLGDAFASGGSVGYDHKAMGITAKGAWEAVRRHFREIGVDTQTQDFTVVGIGDMSGDVFGNGMLCSPHIRLVAAFDHRHIFLDPDPNAARSFAERQRMFNLPRSSWDDYDTSLISPGGGIYPRDLKSVPVSPQVATMLGLGDVAQITPPALIRAILCAPVDLLFNGGIGTYVKAETESQADVGDRANDAVRVNGNQLRAKVVGEGGNLGFTPLGRVEFDLAGGRINTDALDNSAGVDCSDHEVNIKILINSLVTLGKVDPAERPQLLSSMTDEVSALVLADNAAQNDVMGTSRANAASMLPVHSDQIRHLVADHGLNRELEALPSDKEIRRRAEAGLGLASPELATLMAHVKLTLKAAALATDLPDQDVFAARLPRYFPLVLQERFAEEIRSHQLRREIVTTMLINDVVDIAGIAYAFRITQDVGVGLVDAVRAYVATDAIFGVGDQWRRIRAAGERDRLPVAVTDRMTLDLRRLIDRAARWLLNYRPQPLAVGAEINRFADKVAQLGPQVTEWLRGADHDIVTARTDELVGQGVPEEVAVDSATGLYRYSLLDIIDVADIADRNVAEVAETYFALMDLLGIDGLLSSVAELPRDDRWHSLARLAIRDDIYNSLRALCLDVLAVGEPEENGVQKIIEWESINESRLARARRTLAQIYDSDQRDLATLSVAARQIRSMTQASGRGAAS